MPLLRSVKLWGHPQPSSEQCIDSPAIVHRLGRFEPPPPRPCLGFKKCLYSHFRNHFLTSFVNFLMFFLNSDATTESSRLLHLETCLLYSPDLMQHSWYPLYFITTNSNRTQKTGMLWRITWYSNYSPWRVLKKPSFAAAEIAPHCSIVVVAKERRVL